MQVIFTLLSECQGLGFATGAIQKLIRYAFEELDLERLIATMAAENTASIKVAERVGMT